MHISDEKALLRTRIKERADRVSASDRDAESRSICRRVMENLPEGQLTICAYYPMPSEVDVRPLIEKLLKKGHPVYLPRFNRVYFEFRKIENVDDLVPGKFNLPEPPASAPLLDIKTVSLALLPAVAFDRSGGRLGRGNGGYDRWIQELKKVNPQAKIWGISFDHQIADTVPMEAHDQRVDAVMTAREAIFCDR